MRVVCLFIVLLCLPVLAEDVRPSADEFFKEFRTPLAVPTDGENRMRGQLRPVNYTVLSSGLDAKLTSLSVKTGSRVRKGDVIARFKCDAVRSELTIGKARMSVAQENLQVNERLQQLNNVSGIDLATSIAELAIATAEVERTTAIESECVVSAPFSGVITEKFVQNHQYLQKGDTIVEIVDTENLEIEMVLPSLDLDRYRQGSQFTIRIDETGQLVDARVDRIVDVIDPVSQTIRVIGRLVEPPPGLMPGMSGIISF